MVTYPVNYYSNFKIYISLPWQRILYLTILHTFKIIFDSQYRSSFYHTIDKFFSIHHFRSRLTWVSWSNAMCHHNNHRYQLVQSIMVKDYIGPHSPHSVHVIKITTHKYHSIYNCGYSKNHLDGLVRERCNSSVLAMELHLSCINPSI